MKVVSLFDGMGCLATALHELNIKPDKLLVSEVDKWAVKQTKFMFPEIEHIGDVRNVDGTKFKGIDLLAGGSPCKNFSFAGNRNGMSTVENEEVTTLERYLELKYEGFEFEGESYLFWEFVRILRESKPKYFLLENVKMEPKWRKVISRALGIAPIRINSNLQSAQNRDRYYWANIYCKPEGLYGDLKCHIPQPKDEGILLKDILQPESEIDEKYYLSNKMVKCLVNHSNRKQKEGCRFKFNPAKSFNIKAKTINARYYKMGVDDNYICVAMRGRNKDNPNDRTAGSPTEQRLEPKTDGKTNTLTTVSKDNLILGCDIRTDEGIRVRENGKSGTLAARARTDESCGQNVVVNHTLRRLTPIECMRLQTVPEWYKWSPEISDSQKYKMIGNGWTIKPIMHILSYMDGIK